MTRDQYPDSEALDEAADILRGVAAGGGETRAGAVESWCQLACTRLERAGAITGIEQPRPLHVPARGRITEALARLATLTDDCLDNALIIEAVAAAQRALAATRARP
jgi:hypothetical protein